MVWSGGNGLHGGGLEGSRQVEVQGKVLQEEGTVRAKAGRQAASGGEEPCAGVMTEKAGVIQVKIVVDTDQASVLRLLCPAPASLCPISLILVPALNGQ